MSRNILVAYATKYGATAGIAQKIGEVLNASGHRADVQSVDSVSDISRYDAFVVGGSVYIGRMRKEARRFLKQHVSALSARPVWLFASGPTDDKPVDPRMGGFAAPQSMQELVQKITPRDTRIFGGSIDPTKASGLDKWMLSKVGAKITDARNWEEIAAWAGEIASQLQ